MITLVCTTIVFMLLDARLYYPAIFEIIQTGNWITDQIGVELKELGTTEPQFNVLRILSQNKGNPMTVQSILNQMVQRTSNVTRIVDKLSERGLVIRKECLSNRRKMDITITQTGLELMKDLNRQAHAFHEPLMKNLAPEEARSLTELLKKLKTG